VSLYDLAALRARRDRLDGARYAAGIRDLSDAELDREARDALGGEAEGLSGADLTAALEDAIVADLGSREPADLTGEDRRQLEELRRLQDFRGV